MYLWARWCAANRYGETRIADWLNELIRMQRWRQLVFSSEEIWWINWWKIERGDVLFALKQEHLKWKKKEVSGLCIRHYCKTKISRGPKHYFGTISQSTGIAKWSKLYEWFERFSRCWISAKWTSLNRQPEIQSSQVREILQRSMGQTNSDCKFQIFISTKFPTPATFACWKKRFKTEVCTCSQFPTEAMQWIKEVELVDSADELRTSSSICGISMPNLNLQVRQFQYGLEFLTFSNS